MIAWLPVAVLAAGQAVLRLISLVAAVWQERVHARSNCAQMSTAAANDVLLFERRQDGTALLIIPRSPLSQARDSATGHINTVLRGCLRCDRRLGRAPRAGEDPYGDIESLIRALHDELGRVAFRYLGCYDDAKEAVQEGCIKASRCWPKIAGFTTARRQRGYRN